MKMPKHQHGVANHLQCIHDADTKKHSVLAAEEETALGSVAWNLSLSPASLSPDTRLTSNAELLSINSLAPSGHLSNAF